MDCRAVTIFLCLLITQASCKPVLDTKAWNTTIQQMQEKIGSLLKQLDESKVLPDLIPCAPWNITGLIRPQQQPIGQLSTFRCLLQKLTGLAPQLQLDNITQYIQDMESSIRSRSHSHSRTSSQVCSLPQFEHGMESFMFLKCLLEFLNQHLGSAEFLSSLDVTDLF